MQVTEVATEGLKRAYSVVVPAADISAARDRRLGEVAKTLRIPGFRPGKVPMSVVKGRYGAAVMGEVLEERVQDATRQVVNERGLKPALQPKVEVVKFEDESDLEFRLDVEVLPEIALPDFSGIEVERPRAEPSDEEVQKALDTLAARNAKLEDVTEDRPAAKGDVVVSDFVGRLIEGGENLISSPGAEGTALPEGWALTTSRGDHASVVGQGNGEEGRWIDIQVRPGEGEKTLQAFRVSFRNGDLPVAEGDSFELSTAWRLSEGELPEGVTTQVLLEGMNAEGKMASAGKANAPAPGAEPAAGQRIAAEWTVPEGSGVVRLRPSIRLAFTQPPSGPITLRLVEPRLTKGGEGEVGEPFQGGTANDMPIEVGGEGFIPGFTEGLEGIRPGETRKVRVTFPEAYGSAELAGKPAEFEITAKALKIRAASAADDEFAKSLGLESLEKLREELKSSLQREYDGLARMKVKRALLDALADRADFPVPEGMVEAEFGQIWQRIEADRQAGRGDPEDAGKSEEDLKAEYRRIAERRIRLGLLLSEIGRTNNIQVSGDEMARAMRNEAARYPGQEKQVMEFFQKNPQAAENIRAPLFEEKVIDFMLELAKVNDRTVTPAELQAA